MAATQVDLRVEVTPRSAFALPRRGGADGVLRHDGGVLRRLLHNEGRPVVVRVAQTARDRVLFGAQAQNRQDAEYAIDRMRFALCVDDDLSDFHTRFAPDPLIGASVRARPHLRPARRPEPFEALAWAICEQLIDFPRAAAIERRIVWRLGRRCTRTGLRDLPAVQTIADAAPARFQSFDLSLGRALALIKCAREVTRGLTDLHAPDHETGWRRLRRIPGVGSWTLSVLALHGQGRYDVIPAGDLNYMKLVGRLLAGGDPNARASEQQVLDFFAPYGEWAGLAGAHALSVATSPDRAGTRLSAAPPVAA
ncbi:MAG TPA: hypothetical protein VNT22_08420 [Baekduia sp.]|nr:hypothetical protein [Baekduia sp.]